MTKKLVAPKLPDNPTEEQKEAFRISVGESMKRFRDFTPQENNRFMAEVLHQLIANGMMSTEGTLPEGITTSPIIPGPTDVLKGRFIIRRPK